MALASMLAFVVIIQQCAAGGTVNKTTIQILQGSDVCARTGDELTFNCVVFSSATRAIVKWFFKNDIKTKCKNLSSTCNLTISVHPAAAGEYKCQLTDLVSDRGGVDRTVLLNVDVCDRRDTILHLLDPATGGVLDDPEYGPVCVKSGTARRFECRIQDARPGVWSFTWMLGNQTIATKSEARTRAGLVNVSSWHIVTNPGNETRECNLTCLATSADLSLNTRVLITFCAKSEYVKMVLRVLVSICVTATIATIITHILLCKYYGYI